MVSSPVSSGKSSPAELKVESILLDGAMLCWFSETAESGTSIDSELAILASMNDFSRNVPASIEAGGLPKGSSWYVLVVEILCDSAAIW